MIFSKKEIRCVFRNAPVFEGDITEVGDHVRKHDAAFRDTTVGGRKAAVFPTFIPTTKEQRLYLGFRLGCKIKIGQAYTFATRFSANQFAKELRCAGVGTKPSNWTYGIIQLPAKEPDNQEELPL